jgi:EAL domain-containing protein (putative c-di-GMP-specific phosphodiesterase class I)
VHEIKIDRSFVSGMNLNRGNQTIVRATIGLAKQLGLRATAEGVETVAELRTLAAMGCDEVQGYYVAKPMLAHEVFGWIEARRASEATSRRGDLELLVDP